MTRETSLKKDPLERMAVGLEQLYGPMSPEIQKSVRVMLEALAEKFGGLENLSGKTILDLGCGCLSKDAAENRAFEPWLSRALLILGAKPIGIDSGNLDGEKFEHYQINLSQPGSLDFLPEKSVDATVIFLLWGSRQMREALQGGSRTLDDVKNEIGRQVVRITRDFQNIIERG